MIGVNIFFIFSIGRKPARYFDADEMFVVFMTFFAKFRGTVQRW